MADIKYTKDHEWIRLDQDPQSGPFKGLVVSPITLKNSLVISFLWSFPL